MAVELATGYVNIIPSTRGLGKSILGELGAAQRQAEPEASTGGKRLGGKLAGGFKSALVGGMGAAVAAVAAIGIGQQLTSAIMDAGDYEQSIGAISAVFKDQAGTMYGYARDSANSVGLTKNSYQELATTLGALLKNGGTPLEELGDKTHNLIGLGADLASMFGGTTAENVEKLTAALKGEFDPLDSVGVSLSAAAVEAEAAALGLEKVGDEYTAQAKQQATLSLIYKQTADAQGNFARESETFSHKLQVMGAQWGDLKVKIGGLFLPALTRVFGYIGETAIPAMTEFTGGLRAFFAAFKAGDGDITSDGLAGRMEELGYKVRLLYNELEAKLAPAFRILSAFIRDGVIPVLAALGKWLYDNRDLIKGIAVVAGSMFVAFKAVALATAGVTAGVAAVTGVVGTAVKFLGSLRYILLGARIAFVMLNVAMRANPIGIIVTAITGLVVGLKLAYDNVGWFKDAVDAAWRGIVTATQWLGDMFAAAWAGIKVGLAAVSAWWTGTVVVNWRKGTDAVAAGFRWLGDVARVVWDGIKLVTAVVVGLVIGYYTLVYRALKFVLGPVFVWLRDNVVIPVMAGVRRAVDGLRAWFVGTAVPALRSAVQFFADKLTWLRDNIVTPVVSRVRAILDGLRSWLANTAVPALRSAVQFFADKLTWLRDTIVAPVVSRIRAILDGFRAWFRDVLVAGIRERLDVLGGRFKWLRDNVIRPVWDGIKGIIGRAWDAIRSRTFDPLVRFARETIPAAFRAAKDGVAEQWEKLKGVVKGPVAWVIDHVINDPLIKSVNSVLRSVGLKDKQIGEISSGFRKGGYTGNIGRDEVAGVVHGREQVIRAQSTEQINRAAPGLLDRLNAHGAAALRGIVDPGQAAVGDTVYGTARSFNNAINHHIMRTGVMQVGGHAPGWSLDQAIRMLDAATSIKVRRGNGRASNGVDVFARNYPAWWAGYYMNDDRSVMLNNRTMGNASPTAKRTVAVHELGHALGLPHAHPEHGGNNAWSVMNYHNMYRHNSVTPADVAALSQIYGGHGKAGAGASSPAEDGGGDVTGVIAKLVKPILDFVGNIGRKITDQFPGGGLAVDVVRGMAGKVGDGIKGWIGGALGNAKDAILEKVDGVGDWVGDRLKGLKGILGLGAMPAGMGAPKLYDSGGLLHKGLQVIDHQRSAPDKVLTDAQWSAVYGTHKAVASGRLATRESSERPTVQVVIPEREGISPDHLGQRAGEAAAWAMIQAGL